MARVEPSDDYSVRPVMTSSQGIAPTDYDELLNRVHAVSEFKPRAQGQQWSRETPIHAFSAMKMPGNIARPGKSVPASLKSWKTLSAFETWCAASGRNDGAAA